MGLDGQQEEPSYMGQLNITSTAWSSLEAKLQVQFAANTLLALMSVMPISIARLAIKFMQMRFVHIK